MGKRRLLWKKLYAKDVVQRHTAHIKVPNVLFAHVKKKQKKQKMPIT